MIEPKTTNDILQNEYEVIAMHEELILFLY